MNFQRKIVGKKRSQVLEKTYFLKFRLIFGVWTKHRAVLMKRNLGPERYQSNRLIRKLLKLADASKNDVFYDLGCGIGQLCVVAVAEFGVKKAVGIESHRGRAKKAEKRVKDLGLDDRIEIKNEDFWESDLSEATIVYFGQTESDEDLTDFEKKLSPGCKMITLFLPLVGVMPTKVDYPFYLMQLPFKKTENAEEWVSAVLSKRASLEELYQELDSDKEYCYGKSTFKRMVKKRFSK